MKRAYVKPVYMADEFEMTASVAGCGLVSVTKGWELIENKPVCTDPHGGHTYSPDNLENTLYNDTLSYFDYATKTDDKVVIFTDSNNVCDFLWKTNETLNGRTELYVWDSADKTGSVRENSIGKGFMQFFGGNNSPHGVGTIIDDEVQTPFS